MITQRVGPDPSGKAWKLVSGWWCPCVGPDAGVRHHSIECSQRIAVQEWVATYPDWRPPRATWLDVTGVAAEQPQSTVIAPCRPALPAEVPIQADRLAQRAVRLGLIVRSTRAKGMARRKSSEPDAGGARHFEPWPIESVVLRVQGLMNLAWTRLQGELKWKPEGGYARFQERIVPITVTQGQGLLRELERKTAACDA